MESERMFSGSYSRTYFMVSGPQGRYINSSNLPKEAYFEKYGFTLCDNVTVQRIKVSRVKSKKKKCYCSSSGLK